MSSIEKRKKTKKKKTKPSILVRKVGVKLVVKTKLSLTLQKNKLLQKTVTEDDKNKFFFLLLFFFFLLTTIFSDWQIILQNF